MERLVAPYLHCQLIGGEVEEETLQVLGRGVRMIRDGKGDLARCSFYFVQMVLAVGICTFKMGVQKI